MFGLLSIAIPPQEPSSSPYATSALYFRQKETPGEGRGAVDGLGVSSLHRPVQEAVELLPAHLAHPCALFPLGQALHR